MIGTSIVEATNATEPQARRSGELESQVLRLQSSLRDQHRLQENAEMVQSLQSALHAQVP
jgi:hypothetical protein